MTVDLNFEHRLFDMYTEEEIEKECLACVTMALPFIPNVGDTFVWDKTFHNGKPPMGDKSWEVLKDYSFEVRYRVVYSSGYVVLNLEII